MLTGFKVRDAQGAKYTIGVLAYIILAYLGGWAALFSQDFAINVVGVMFCTHGMVIAAYLLHDCGHNAVFVSASDNARLGNILNWITGSCYGRFEDIRYKHMRHHVDNCDPVGWDYRSFLKRHPALDRTVKFAEWAYIPAVEILMHSMLVLAPWVLESKQKQRARTLIIVSVRGGVLFSILLLSPKAFALYALCQLLLLTVLRFMDCYQHNYDLVFSLDDETAEFPRRGDAVFEQHNTYSNLLSHRHPLVNMLVLNFCYHNAHHKKPVLGWYRLPALHAQMFAAQGSQSLSFLEQVRSFHKYRVARVHSEVNRGEDVRSSLQSGKAVGVDALSFLTAF